VVVELRIGMHSSAFWQAYAAILPTKPHRAVGKQSGETSHIERFNLGQRLTEHPRGKTQLVFLVGDPKLSLQH
jgi:hypothetical protein